MPRVKLVFASLAAQIAPLLWAGFRLTVRVAEPEGLARRLPLLANGVTDRGLGVVSKANEAGNPVLAEGAFGDLLTPNILSVRRVCGAILFL
jgi:hypothetical protein